MTLPSLSFLLTMLPMALTTSLPVARSVPVGDFGLYGYGDDIGGLPVLYSNGTAFIGNVNSTGASNDTATVLFTADSNSRLMANPDVAATDSTPSWGNMTYYVPTTSSSHETGFNGSAMDDITATGFYFYGSSAMRLADDGSLQSAWYVVPSSDMPDWYELKWNATDEEADQVLITLKTTPPSDS